jgi:hypothetical protein
MTINALCSGKMPHRLLRNGLLAAGIASMVPVLAATAPADAAVTGSGSGMTLSVVSVQLVNKVAVDVNLAVTCAPSPTDASMFSIINFTLSENVKGTIVSVPGGTGFTYPPITCDGTSHAVTFTLLPQNGATWFKPGPAYVSGGSAAAFPSDGSCGITWFGGGPAPLPCGTATFSGGVQINGGAN